jgi:hypothetical protein
MDVDEFTMKPPSLSFDHIILRAPQALPILPLLHTTSADRFLGQIVSASELRTAKCGVYNEDLLYTFYGRPAYKPNAGTLNTSLASFRPICFLLRPTALGNIKRVVPLDTGALDRGVFSRYVTRMMTKDRFELPNTIEGAAKFVKAFFDDNKRYYFGQIHPSPAFEPTDLLAEAYCAIVADKGTSEVDDRRSTIEVQFSDSISLNPANVMAIVLPSAFLDTPPILNFVKNVCGAEAIEYDIYSDRPAADVREVMARVRDYLTNRGFL